MLELDPTRDFGEEQVVATGEDSPSTCPVCDSPENVVYFEPESAHAVEGNGGDVAGDETSETESAEEDRTPLQAETVLRCKRCRLGFRRSRPDEATLAKFYEQQDLEPYLSEISGRRWTARRRWEIVKPLMLRGHVLDIGCASGLFLEQVERGGWTGTGIDPSPTLCDHARDQMGIGVNVLCGTLESSGFPPSLFNVVTLWDVLEHAPKPGEFLRASSVPLKPGGYVLLNVPYIDSSAAQLMGARWPLLLPEHLNYFSRKSLLHCAEDAGLILERFGRRSSIFSLGYTMQRLAERGIPMASGLKALFAKLNIEDWLIPAPIGEILAIFRKPEA